MAVVWMQHFCIKTLSGDLRQPEAFSSTRNQQSIGGIQTIKTFPESVSEINTQHTTQREGEKKSAEVK